MQLFNAITKVITVRSRITTAKDGNCFAAKIHVLDFVDEVIPGSPRTILISSCVPGRTTNNDAIKLSQVLRTVVTDILSLNASSFSDVACNCLGVACLRRVEQTHCFAGRASPGRASATAAPPAATRPNMSV